MKLTTSAFSDGSPIPAQHTCDGANASPPLAWSDAPPATKTFALIMDDPDAPAGTWVHWVVWNLPPTLAALPTNVARTETLKTFGAALQGNNTSRRIGYDGPCPPPGKPHRYYFKLYALDTALSLEPGSTKADVERAMRGHVAAEAQVMGTYGRTR